MPFDYYFVQILDFGYQMCNLFKAIIKVAWLCEKGKIKKNKWVNGYVVLGRSIGLIYDVVWCGVVYMLGF